MHWLNGFALNYGVQTGLEACNCEIRFSLTMRLFEKFLDILEILECVLQSIFEVQFEIQVEVHGKWP